MFSSSVTCCCARIGCASCYWEDAIRSLSCMSTDRSALTCASSLAGANSRRQKVYVGWLQRGQHPVQIAYARCPPPAAHMPPARRPHRLTEVSRLSSPCLCCISPEVCSYMMLKKEVAVVFTDVEIGYAVWSCWGRNNSISSKALADWYFTSPDCNL